MLLFSELNVYIPHLKTTAFNCNENGENEGLGLGLGLGWGNIPYGRRGCRRHWGFRFRRTWRAPRRDPHRTPRSDLGSCEGRWGGRGRRRRGLSCRGAGTCWRAEWWGLCLASCGGESTDRRAYTRRSWSRTGNSPCPSPFRISMPSAPPLPQPQSSDAVTLLVFAAD